MDNFSSISCPEHEFAFAFDKMLYIVLTCCIWFCDALSSTKCNNISYGITSVLIFLNWQFRIDCILNLQISKPKALVRLVNIFKCLAYDWTVKDEWKVTWYDPKWNVARWYYRYIVKPKKKNLIWDGHVVLPGYIFLFLSLSVFAITPQMQRV